MARRFVNRRSTKRSELVRALQFVLAVSVFVFGLGFVSVDEPALFDIKPAAAQYGGCPPNDPGCNANPPPPPTTAPALTPEELAALFAYLESISQPPPPPQQPGCPPGDAGCNANPPPVVTPPVVTPPVVTPPVVTPPVVTPPVVTPPVVTPPVVTPPVVTPPVVTPPVVTPPVVTPPVVTPPSCPPPNGCDPPPVVTPPVVTPPPQTPEQQCALDGGGWTIYGCWHQPSCGDGQHWVGQVNGSCVDTPSLPTETAPVPPGEHDATPGEITTYTAGLNRIITITLANGGEKKCELTQGYNDVENCGVVAVVDENGEHTGEFNIPDRIPPGCQPGTDGCVEVNPKVKPTLTDAGSFELSVCSTPGVPAYNQLVDPGTGFTDGGSYCGSVGSSPPPETETVTVVDPVTNIETITETVTDPVTNIETITETVTDPVTNIETVTETETVTDPVTNIETVTVTVTVVDPVVEPSQPTIEWGAVPSSVREGGTITLRLVSDSPVANNLEVAVWFFASEADAGDIAPEASCGPASGRALVMTIPAGQRSVDCAVTAVRNDDDGDGDVDDGEDFIETVGLWKVEPAGETTNLGNAGVSFNIRDNDPPPPDAVQNLALTCVATNANPTEFRLSATWTAPVDGAVSVQAELTENPDVGWWTINGAATSPYTADVTAAGSYRTNVIPYLTGGNIGVSSEAFAECVVPVISITDAGSVDEGGSLSYTVSMTPAASSSVSVDWATTSGGTAFAGTDYRSGSGTVTFAAGETTKTVTVATLSDTNSPEPDETVEVELSNANVAAIGTATASGTIRDVPPPPVVSLMSTALSVAETSTAGVQITAVLNKPASAAASVTVTATGAGRGAGSCYAGVEFYLSSSTFSFSVGADRASITLYPCVDADYSNETINVNLTSVGIANLTLGSPTTAVVTITDPAPVVSFAGPVSVDESSGSVTFTVEVPAAVTSAVSVTVNTSNGTATAGSDYTAVVNRLVTIGVGSRSATVSVTILDDATVETDETFTVTLTNPTNATLGTVTATGTIRNDDVPPPTTVPGPGF